MILQVSVDKHEADLRIINEIYCEIATCMTLNNLEYMFRVFSKIPEEKIDELALNLLK